jgi:hypothetical protein
MVAARIGDNEQTAAELEQKLFNGIDQAYASNAQTRQGITTRLEGAVGSKLAALDDKAGKVVGKLVKNGNRMLGQAYTYGYPAGMVFPTDEQVLYGLQTGDVLGSMGLAPTASVDGTRVPTAPGAATVELSPPVGAVPTLPPVQPAPPGAPPGGVSPPGPTFPPAGGPPAIPPATAPPPPAGPAWVNPAARGCAPGPPVVGGWTVQYDPTRARDLPQGGFYMPPWQQWVQPRESLAQLMVCPDPAAFGPGVPAGLKLIVHPFGTLWVDPAGQLWESSNGSPGPDYCPVPFSPCAGEPAPAAPPTCPPGSTWTVYNPVTVLAPGATARGGPAAARSTPCPSGMPRVYGGWTQYFDPATVVNTPYGAVTYAPWLEPSSSPNQLPPRPWCVPDGCMDKPTGADRVVYTGAAEVLYVDAAGRLVAGTPGLPVGQFYQVPANACPVDGGSGGGAPGGGSCVPAVPPGAHCPAPDVPTCGPMLTGSLAPLQAADDEVCKAITAAIDKIKGENADVAKWVGMQTGDPGDDSVTVSIMKSLLGVKNPIIADLVNRFAKWLQEFLKRGTNALGCDQAALIPMMINRGVFRLINHWTGAVPEQLLTEIDQVGHTICQSILPGVAEADRAFMADAIGQDVWECWVKAAGHHVKEAQAVRDGGRTRPDFRQAWMALKRGYIGQERYKKLVRADGVVTDDDLNDLAALQCWWPGPEKLIRWMKKDVFDQAIVDRFELDTDFDKKYTDRTRQLADGQGISEEFLRNEWRGHWENVGTSAMFECMRRLRPGHADPAVVTTQDDVRQAMKQQDIPPFWVERLIAISYAKPTRVDVRRMWTLHLIEKDELKRRVLDLGYTDADADLMVRFWETDRDVKEARMNGLPTGRALVNAYARGELTARELEGIAQKISYYDGQEEEIQEAAELGRDMAERRNAIAAVRRRYTRGLIGGADAAAELASVNVDGDEIESLLKWWDQVQKRTGREVTAAMLCQWRASHLISASEQMAALVRIGYNSADAGHITAQCTLDIAQKQQAGAAKAEAAAVKAAAAAAKKDAADRKAAAPKPRFRIPAQPPAGTNGAAGH